MKRDTSMIKRINESINTRCEKSFLRICSQFSPVANTRYNYKKRFGKVIDLKNPQTFNEKISWLKLYHCPNNQMMIDCSDKYYVRKFVTEMDCGEILNELYYAWDSPEQINWDILPSQFVLKWNYGMGFNFICEDKGKYDYSEVVSRFNRWKKDKFWLLFSEFHYSYIKPKLICEKYLNDGSGKLPIDYKVYCFNGEPVFVCLCKERENGHPKFGYFDINGNELRYSNSFHKVELDLDPELYQKLFIYSKKLCSSFIFVRVDFYVVGRKIYFGELTFTPCAGLDNDFTEDTDKMLGEKLDIRILIEKKNTGMIE